MNKIIFGKKVNIHSKFDLIVLFVIATCTIYPSLVYAQPKCNGLEATIIGTAEDDVIDGTSGPDVIVGLAGNDVIRGFEGDDVICGGIGNDLLIGGTGDDLIFGGSGSDTLRGKPGNDVLSGGRGNDTLNGGLDTDECTDQIGRNTYISCEGHSCDFVPDNTGEFYLKGDCISLANAFDCDDFSYEGGICELFGCDDCLCSAYHFNLNVDRSFGCDIEAAVAGCFDHFFNEESNQCASFVCLGRQECGPNQ